MILADVVLAAPTNTYVLVAVLFGIVVVPLEVACFFAFQRRVAGFWSSLGLIALANAVSLLAGFAITAFVPLPEGFAQADSSSGYHRDLVIGFIAAFFLSWGIEYAVVRLFQRRFAFARLGRTLGVANLASYLAILTASIWGS